LKSITPDDNNHTEKKWNFKFYCHDYYKGMLRKNTTVLLDDVFWYVTLWNVADGYLLFRETHYLHQLPCRG